MDQETAKKVAEANLEAFLADTERMREIEQTVERVMKWLDRNPSVLRDDSLNEDVIEFRDIWNSIPSASEQQELDSPSS